MSSALIVRVLPVDLSVVAKRKFTDGLFAKNELYVKKLDKRFKKFLKSNNIPYRVYKDAKSPNKLYIIEYTKGVKKQLNNITNITYVDTEFNEYHIELSYGI